MEDETTMFNPFKMVWNSVCISCFVTVLSFTHYQAFKMGATVQQNPMLEKTAQVLGIIPEPPKPARNDGETPLSDVLDWLKQF
jgi:hypothetical protein